MNRKKPEHIHMFEGNGSPLVCVRQERNAPCSCGSGKKAKKCCGVAPRYFKTKPDPVKEPANPNITENEG